MERDSVLRLEPPLTSTIVYEPRRAWVERDSRDSAPGERALHDEGGNPASQHRQKGTRDASPTDSHTAWRQQGAQAMTSGTAAPAASRAAPPVHASSPQPRTGGGLGEFAQAAKMHSGRPDEVKAAAKRHATVTVGVPLRGAAEAARLPVWSAQVLCGR
jgi:hypothetical protein